MADRINTKEESFHAAIVDGINNFVNALNKRGLINQDTFDAIAAGELLELKHQIAHDLAIGWAKMPWQ